MEQLGLQLKQSYLRSWTIWRIVNCFHETRYLFLHLRVWTYAFSSYNFEFFFKIFLFNLELKLNSYKSKLGTFTYIFIFEWGFYCLKWFFLWWWFFDIFDSRNERVSIKIPVLQNKYLFLIFQGSKKFICQLVFFL